MLIKPNKYKKRRETRTKTSSKGCKPVIWHPNLFVTKLSKMKGGIYDQMVKEAIARPLLAKETDNTPVSFSINRESIQFMSFIVSLEFSHLFLNGQGIKEESDSDSIQRFFQLLE